jgi:AraC-like DNA-binding protein
MPMTNLRRNINGALIMAGMAAERGLSLRAFLAGTGIKPAELEEPSITISFDQEFRLIRNLLYHCQVPAGVGMEIGCRYRFTTLAPVGFALVSSPNYRSAFDIILRYADLNTSLVQVVLDAKDKDLRIGFLDELLPTDLQQFAVERSMGVAVAIAREVLERNIVPRAIEFNFPRPPGAHIYRTLTGVAPLFDRPKNLLILKDADVEVSLAHRNSLALRLAEEQCRQYLATWRSRSGLAGRVREIIARQPRNMPDMSDVASALYISVRTLRRRLQEEGTSYLALSDEVREALAEQLLAMPLLPIEQIAERLGYSESASFIHAFKRWKGLSPSAYRRLQIVSHQ